MPLNPAGEIHIGDNGSAAFGVPDHVATPEEWEDYLGKITTIIEVPKGNNKWGTKRIKVKLIDVIVQEACKAFVAQGAKPPIELTEQSFLVQEYRHRRLVVVTVQHRIGAEDYYATLPIILPEQEVAWLRVTGRWSSKQKAPDQAVMRMPAILDPAPTDTKH